MNIENYVQVTSKPGKHGRIKSFMIEVPSSDDGTLDETLTTNSTFFFIDQAVRHDEVYDKRDVSMEKSVSYGKVRTLTCNLFSENVIQF